MADGEETVKVSNSNHKEKVLSGLNEYRHSKYLCDISIVVQGHEFPAHKAVLAAAGGYFSGLFAAKMMEEAEIQDHSVVHLNEVDPSVMDEVLTYIYCGEIELTRENAQLFLVAVDFLSLSSSLEDCKDAIGEFLGKVIEATPPDTKDLLFILQFADHYSCKRLQEVALRLVLSNFETVLSESNEIFLNLTANIIEEIISSDELVISSEKVVFEAIVVWAKNKDERKDSFHRLFQKVRLCSFKEEFLRQSVLRETLVASNPDCVNLVLGTLESKYNPATPDGPRPRSCLDPYTDAVIIFPFDDVSDNGIWCYAPSIDTWRQIPTDDGYGHGDAVYYDGSIYFVYQGDYDLVVVRYELETNTWSDVIEFDNERSVTFQNVACLNGIIYIVGGNKFIDEDQLELVSVPDVQSCVVRGTKHGSPALIKFVAPMNTSRSAPAVVTDSNYLYVIGGYIYTSDDHYETNTVERYDPMTDSWTYLASTKLKGAHGSASLAGDKIFLSQTQSSDDDNGVDIFDYEIYDICDDFWFQIQRSTVILGRSNLVAFSDKVSNVLCLSEGHSILEFYYSTYDYDENIWKLKSSVVLETPWMDCWKCSAIAVRLPKRSAFLANNIELEDV